MRHAVIALLVLTGISLHYEVTHAATRLHSTVVVDSPLISLGDIFHGLSETKAQREVGNAPEPGRRIALRMATINKIAKLHGIKLKPDPTIRAVIVQRASRLLTPADVKPAITEAIKDTAIGGDFVVELRARDLKAFLPLRGTFEVEVIHLSYDEKSARIVGTVRLTGPDFSPVDTKIKGFVRHVVDTPVLTRRILRGEILRDSDITYVDIPENRLAANVAMDISDLLGKEAKRMLRQGKPVRLLDLQTPRLIRKGSLVTMLVKTPMMTLRTIGQALENGGKGDVIRIVNTRSRKTVTGVVAGRNAIHVPLSGYLELLTARN